MPGNSRGAQTCAQFNHKIYHTILVLMFSSFNPDNHLFQSSQFQQVIQNAVDFLLTTPVQPLPPSQTFTGAGLYLLYYTGNFPPYSAIAQANSQQSKVSTDVQKLVAGKARITEHRFIFGFRGLSLWKK